MRNAGQATEVDNDDDNDDELSLLLKNFEHLL